MAKFLVSIEKAPQLGCGGLLVIGVIIFVIAKSGSSSSSREDEIVRNTPPLFPPSRMTNLPSSNEGQGRPQTTAESAPRLPLPSTPAPAPEDARSPEPRLVTAWSAAPF